MDGDQGRIEVGHRLFLVFFFRLVLRHLNVWLGAGKSLDAGNVAGDISALVKNGGPAAAGSPIRAEIHAKVGKLFQGVGRASAARASVKAVENSIAKIPRLTEGVAIAKDGIARRQLVVQRHGDKVRWIDPEEGGIHDRIHREN